MYSAEQVSLLKLRVLSNDEYVSFDCNFVGNSKTTNQPSCKYYKAGGYKNECKFYDGELSNCRNLKAIEHAIVVLRESN